MRFLTAVWTKCFRNLNQNLKRGLRKRQERIKLLLPMSTRSATILPTHFGNFFRQQKTPERQTLKRFHKRECTLGVRVPAGIRPPRSLFLEPRATWKFLIWKPLKSFWSARLRQPVE